MKRIYVFFIVLISSTNLFAQLIDRATLIIEDKTYLLNEENILSKKTFEKIDKLSIKEFNPEKYSLEITWKINNREVQKIQPKDNNALNLFAQKFAKPTVADWIVFDFYEIKSEQKRSFKILFSE
ncbi:MAG: hypothetical protein ACK4K9_10895 [Bacteroidia bacterium]